MTAGHDPQSAAAADTTGAADTTDTAATGVLDVVLEHLDAFAARDVERVIATFADDAVFTTGDGTVIGRTALRRLFTDAFALPVHVDLERRAVHATGDTVACEIVEHITAEGVTHTMDLAGFYTVRGGALVRVRVYRDALA